MTYQRNRNRSRWCDDLVREFRSRPAGPVRGVNGENILELIWDLRNSPMDFCFNDLCTSSPISEGFLEPPPVQIQFNLIYYQTDHDLYFVQIFRRALTMLEICILFICVWIGLLMVERTERATRRGRRNVIEKGLAEVKCRKRWGGLARPNSGVRDI